MALHLGAVPDAMEALLDALRRQPRAGRCLRLQRPLRRRHASARHLHDQADLRRRAACRASRSSSPITATWAAGCRARMPPIPPRSSRKACAFRHRGCYDRGEPNATLLGIIRANVRVARTGDRRPRRAARHLHASASARSLRLIERHGEARLARLFRRAARLWRSADPHGASPRWPDGTYRFADYIDGDGFTEDPIPICCAVTVQGDSLTVDFEGSSPQVRGAINATFSFTKSAAYLAIRCALAQDVPNNAGVYRAITVQGTGPLDPQPRDAGAGRGAGADRLPGGRYRAWAHWRRSRRSV